MAKLNLGGSLIASILAGIGASLCCVGPLVLLAIGISGAWIGNLVAFEPYRPLLIGLTLLFLALAFRKLYLVPQSCVPGATCASLPVMRRQRLIFWIVSVLVLGLLAAPWLVLQFF
ncbi:MAG: mercuric transporter MerT family protein [Pseudomonadota bacterium]